MGHSSLGTTCRSLQTVMALNMWPAAINFLKSNDEAEQARTTLPTLPETLHRQKEGERRWEVTQSFNRRHRVMAPTKLSAGDAVWILDAKAQGTVTSIHPPRVHTWSAGHMGHWGRRTHSHFVPVPLPESKSETPQSCPPEVDISTETVQRLLPLWPNCKTRLALWERGQAEKW